MRPYPHHRTKVIDAIIVLKGRGEPHYIPDVVEQTGLKEKIVRAVLAELEVTAKAKPSGKTTVPWTLHKGRDGGVALSKKERTKAQQQRGKSLQSQLVRHHDRSRAEYERYPHDDEKAMQYARVAYQLGSQTHKSARDLIQRRHLQALLGKGVDSNEAVALNLALMKAVNDF